MNVAGRQVWLWIIIESGRGTVLAVILTEARNIFAAHSLFTCLRHRGVRYVITDGASWYRIAAGWARLRHSVVHSLRSYVERFIEAVNDRLMHRLLLPIS